MSSVKGFSGTVSSGTESRRTVTIVGDEKSGGERMVSRQLLRGERQRLSLSLFGTRSKTRDTTMVARYISKVKDLLFSDLLESIHIRDYTTFHRPLLIPSAMLNRACKCARVRAYWCSRIINNLFRTVPYAGFGLQRLIEGCIR